MFPLFRYHWLCVGISKQPLENQDWFCTRCIAKKGVKYYKITLHYFSKICSAVLWRKRVENVKYIKIKTSFWNWIKLFTILFSKLKSIFNAYNQIKSQKVLHDRVRTFPYFETFWVPTLLGLLCMSYVVPIQLKYVCVCVCVCVCVDIWKSWCRI